MKFISKKDPRKFFGRGNRKTEEEGKAAPGKGVDSFSFKKFPKEVFDRITSFLLPPDIRSLMLSEKYVAQFLLGGDENQERAYKIALENLLRTSPLGYKKPKFTVFGPSPLPYSRGRELPYEYPSSAYVERQENPNELILSQSAMDPKIAHLCKYYQSDVRIRRAMNPTLIIDHDDPEFVRKSPLFRALSQKHGAEKFQIALTEPHGLFQIYLVRKLGEPLIHEPREPLDVPKLDRDPLGVLGPERLRHHAYEISPVSEASPKKWEPLDLSHTAEDRMLSAELGELLHQRRDIAQAYAALSPIARTHSGVFFKRTAEGCDDMIIEPGTNRYTSLLQYPTFARISEGVNPVKLALDFDDANRIDLSVPSNEKRESLDISETGTDTLKIPACRLFHTYDVWRRTVHPAYRAGGTNVSYDWFGVNFSGDLERRQQSLKLTKLLQRDASEKALLEHVKKIDEHTTVGALLAILPHIAKREWQRWRGEYYPYHPKERSRMHRNPVQKMLSVVNSACIDAVLDYYGDNESLRASTRENYRSDPHILFALLRNPHRTREQVALISRQARRLSLSPEDSKTLDRLSKYKDNERSSLLSRVVKKGSTFLGLGKLQRRSRAPAAGEPPQSGGASAVASQSQVVVDRDASDPTGPAMESQVGDALSVPMASGAQGGGSLFGPGSRLPRGGGATSHARSDGSPSAPPMASGALPAPEGESRPPTPQEEASTTSSSLSGRPSSGVSREGR